MHRLMNGLIPVAAWLISSTTWAETTTFKCEYPSYANEEGLHSVESEFVLTFLVDFDTGKGYILGNVGSSEISILQSDGGMSFIEVTAVGNVMTTTMDDSGKSVHSRNSVMFGELLPSQYYGSCE